MLEKKVILSNKILELLINDQFNKLLDRTRVGLISAKLEHIDIINRPFPAQTIAIPTS